MTRESRTAARRAADVLVAPDQRARLEPQPLAHRAVGGQQLAVHRLQHRAGVDAEPVGQLGAVPLVAVQGGGRAVHGGQRAQQRGHRGLVAGAGLARAAAGPRRGRRARRAPGRAPRAATERCRPAAARSSPSGPSAALPGAGQRQRRAGQVAGPDQVVAALGLAGPDDGVAQRQRVDRRRPGGRAGSRGRCGPPPRARSAPGPARPRPGAPWPGWPARRRAPRPPRPAAPRRPGRPRHQGGEQRLGAAARQRRCPARTPRRAAGGRGHDGVSLATCSVGESQRTPPRRSPRGARRCRCRGWRARARPSASVHASRTCAGVASSSAATSGTAAGSSAGPPWRPAPETAKKGTNAMPSSPHRRSRSRSSGESTENRFCTQTTSVTARAASSWSAVTPETPTWPIRPSATSSASAATYGAMSGSVAGCGS